MPAQDNYTYYRQRATTEREHARSAKDPSAAYLHEQLAEAYEGLVAEIGSRPHLRLVEPSIIHGAIPIPDGSDRNAFATR
jgi:hypothetical protein